MKYSQTPTSTLRSSLPESEHAGSAMVQRSATHPRRPHFGTGHEAATLDRMATSLEPKLKALPAKPGVYLFRDANGKILYVGKAKSLRPRVRSYFQQGGDTRSGSAG